MSPGCAPRSVTRPSPGPATATRCTTRPSTQSPLRNCWPSAVTARRDGDPHAAAADAASALALWRGAALQGLTDAAWFGAEARRLDALRLDAQEERFDAALSLGEHREVAPDLRAALDENPYRERLWGQLMLALYRCGRQADALDVFHEARRILSDESRSRAGPGASRPAGGDPRA